MTTSGGKITLTPETDAKSGGALAVDLIRTDGGTQTRAALYENVVNDYATAIGEGAVFPPVVVFHDGETYWLADGFHRYGAHKQCGLVEIDAEIRQGTRRDAVLYSVGANSSHGLRRTNEDKRRAVLMLLEDSEWTRWSDNAIAEKCGVSHPFVGRIRSSLVTVTSEPRTYTTKHGTVATMDTSAIGKAPALRLIDPHQAREIEQSYKQIRAEKIDISRTERLDRIAEISKGNVNLSTAERYPIIYADPPWRYENPPIGATSRAIENHYPTMTLEEICALPVSELATPDAMLYMWATAPKLEECFAVIKAWGFSYRTNMVWDKEIIGMGYHVRNQHEILLFARRGDIPPPAAGTQPSSVYRERRGEHSAKPDYFRDMIHGWYPELPKIELFSRTPQPGWAVWGNQSEAA
jgi:N6-adenosine-specific RNA methylase IME4